MKSEPFLFSGRVPNAYDSHVHWRATGSFARRLDLRLLRNPQELSHLSVQPENKQGDWILGYGWDHNLFSEKKFPTRETLDAVFGETPVYFTRIDAHAAWVNTAALKRSGLWQAHPSTPDGGKILVDSTGFPTGVLIDRAMNLVTRHLPAKTDEDIEADLLAAQKVFHRAGFTHIRDLTCDPEQWSAAVKLEESGRLQLAVEQFFSAEDPSFFEARMELALEARRSPTRLLRAKGVKVFFDGALGSEGAWISRPYSSGSGHGLQLISTLRLREMMRACARENLDFAVHVIGDEAAHRVVQVMSEHEFKNRTAVFHLEHAELLRPETLALLRNIKVVCHMQPCHWLSDKRWLKEKIGDLTAHAFRWHDLEEAGVPFYFGSDTPIEETSLQRNLAAVLDAADHGVRVPHSWASVVSTRAHEHPDPYWTPHTFTDFQEGRPVRVSWQGHDLDI